LVGSVALILLTAAFSCPSVWARRFTWRSTEGKTWWARVIEVNIANLAGVPSIVYGLLGLELFVRALKLERSLLAGACTMALLVLPIIIISSREALRTVLNSIGEASCAGSDQRTIWYQVLPMAFRHPDWSIRLRAPSARRAAHHHRCPHLRGLSPDGLLSPFTAPDSDLQLGVTAPARVSRQRRGRDHRAVAVCSSLTLRRCICGIAPNAGCNCR
jgi:hypothetical protein